MQTELVPIKGLFNQEYPYVALINQMYGSILLLLLQSQRHRFGTEQSWTMLFKMVIICQRKWCQYHYLQNIIVKQSTICWGQHILHNSEFFLTFHIIGSYVIPAKFHVTPYFSTTGPLSCRLRCCFQMKGQIGVVGRKSKQRAHFNQIPPLQF